MVLLRYTQEDLVAEVVHRRSAVRAFYGSPPWSTFYKWLKAGLIPPPDLLLGVNTPAWSDSLITRDQEERRRAAAEGRGRRSANAERVRRGEAKASPNPA